MLWHELGVFYTIINYLYYGVLLEIYNLSIFCDILMKAILDLGEVDLQCSKLVVKEIKTKQKTNQIT